MTNGHQVYMTVLLTIVQKFSPSSHVSIYQHAIYICNSDTLYEPRIHFDLKMYYNTVDMIHHVAHNMNPDYILTLKCTTIL